MTEHVAPKGREAEGLGATLAAVWHQDRRFLVAVTLAIGAVQLVASFLLPIFAVPDEQHHTDLVAVATDYALQGWPGGRERLVDHGVGKVGVRYRRVLSAETAAPRDERPALLLDRPAPTGRFNRMVKHPPLYYLTVDLGEDAVDLAWPGDFTADQEILVYRWISALFLLPLPLLCMAGVRLLGGDGQAARTAAVLPVAIPGLVMRDGALVNNDALLVLLGGIAIVASMHIARGPLRPRDSAIAGVAAGLALLTKIFGVAAVAPVAVAHLVALRRRPVREVLVSAIVASTAGMLAGGWFWVRNLLAYGSPFVGISGRPSVEDFEPDWGYWVLEVVEVTWSQFWGGSYALPGRFSPWLVTATALTLFGAVVALWRRWRQGAGLGVVTISPLLVMAVVAYGHQARRFPVIGRVAGIQGRYFYIAVVGLLPLAAIGWQMLVGRSRRLAAGTVVAAMAITGASSLMMLRTYWGAPDAGLTQKLAAVSAWSPVWAAVFPLAVLAMLAGFALAFRESLRDPVIPDACPPSA